MPETLWELLDRLDPSNMIEAPTRRVDEALNALNPLPAQVAGDREFGDCLLRCYLSIEAAVLELDRPMDSGQYALDIYRCRKVLHDLYGPKGWYTARTRATTGVEGGLRAVINEMARRMLDRTIAAVLQGEIEAWWYDVPKSERAKVVGDYLERFVTVLPQTVVRAGPAIQEYFEKVLEEHIYMVHRLRQAASR
jgi:hypothetical protein